MEIEKFHVIGIAVRTTNENGQSAMDIPKLWGTFFSENLMEQIPNKIDNTLYCLYTDYEKDHTKPYTTILGCRVADLTRIPENMVGKTIGQNTYMRYVAKGNLAQGVVFNEWVKIWNSDLPRAYTTDFEVYGKKAQNADDAEVELFIAVK